MSDPGASFGEAMRRSETFDAEVPGTLFEVDSDRVLRVYANSTILGTLKRGDLIMVLNIKPGIFTALTRFGVGNLDRSHIMWMHKV